MNLSQVPTQHYFLLIYCFYHQNHSAIKVKSPKHFFLTSIKDSRGKNTLMLYNTWTTLDLSIFYQATELMICRDQNNFSLVTINLFCTLIIEQTNTYGYVFFSLRGPRSPARSSPWGTLPRKRPVSGNETWGLVPRRRMANIQIMILNVWFFYDKMKFLRVKIDFSFVVSNYK